MAATCLVFLTANWAQVGPPARQTQPATANPLPLSGRTAQSGSVTATESPVPGTTNSVNTINPTVQVQGPYAGSVGGKVFSGKLSLHEAVERALQYNLGSVGVSNAVRQSRGQSNVARSALLPNLNGNLSETVEQLNLAANGLRFNTPPIAGFPIPRIVGPFNVFDQRGVGLVAQIDVNRSHVQMLTQQQRLVSLENDLAKQKINLARIVGLPPNDRYDLTDDVPFAAAPAINVDDALKQAFGQRPDL